MTSSKTILIIEDRSDIRTLLTTLFTNSGYAVDTASDGETGFNKARIGGYSAIILDLKMPQKDGLSFLKDIKRAPPPTPNGPIVIFSSADYDYAKAEALKLGAADFVSKDEIDPSQLITRVESLIANPNPNTSQPKS